MAVVSESTLRSYVSSISAYVLDDGTTLGVRKIVVYLKFGEEIRLFVSSIFILKLDDDAFGSPRIIYICQQLSRHIYLNLTEKIMRIAQQDNLKPFDEMIELMTADRRYTLRQSLEANEFADWRKVEELCDALLCIYLGNEKLTDELKRDAYEAISVITNLRSEL